MTTVVFIEKKCFICGTIGRFVNVGLLNIGRPIDLDGRPGGSDRSSVYMIMQRCPQCNYCSPEISKGSEDTLKIIRSHDYLHQLNNISFPESANMFLCWAMIQREYKMFSEAGKSSLNAAWVCDDDQKYWEGSLFCRKKAIQLFTKAQVVHQSVGNTRFVDNLLMVDLMRRCGSVQDALIVLKKEREKPHTVHENLILDFQEHLLETFDRKRHTIQEAIDV